MQNKHNTFIPWKQDCTNLLYDVNNNKYSKLINIELKENLTVLASQPQGKINQVCMCNCASVGKAKIMIE